MSNNLKLQVILDTVNRATAPLKQIQRGSNAAAQALRASRDQLKQLESAQKDLKGFANLKRTSQATSQSLNEQQRKVRDLTEQIKATDGPTKRLNQQRNAAIRQAGKLKTRYQNEQIQLQSLRSAIRNTDGMTGTFAKRQRDLSNNIRTANQQMEIQQKRLAVIAKRQRLAAEAAQRYQRATGNAGRMAGAGAGMLGAGVAKGYVAGRVLAPGVGWAEQMATVQAVGRFEVDDPRYKALKKQSRDLGANTAFSANEVGGGQEFLLRAGLSAAAIQASMRDVLDLALANNTELARTADIASNIGGAFKIDMEANGAMANIADVLSGTASRANVDLEMLGETMKYLGGAEDLKLTLEQAAAMSGLLGNIGIQGSQAGTTMRAMMNRLTAPAKLGRKAIESIGLQVADSNGDLRSMPDILRDISNATKNMGNVERKGILQHIFGAEAGSGMAELVSQMSSGALDNLINSLGNNAGENARMAKVMSDNVGGDLKALRSAWEEVGISITDTNNGPLRGLVQSITGVLRGVGNWIKENPRLSGMLAKLAGILIVLTTVGGALTLSLASMLGPIALIRYGMGLLSIQSGGLITSLLGLARSALPAVALGIKAVGLAIAATPVGWLLAAIALIAGAAFLIYKYWAPLKAFFVGFWQGFSGGIGESMSGIKSVLSMLWKFAPIRLVFEGIALVATWLWNGLKKLAVPIESTAAGLEKAGNLGAMFGTILSNLTMLLPNAISAFASWGNNLVDGIISGITGRLGDLKKSVTDMGANVSNWFKDKLGINSPSKVFANFGVNTMEGYERGLQRSEAKPLQKLDGFIEQLRGLGTGVVLSAAATGAIATPALPKQSSIANISSGIKLDTREPLSTREQNITVAGDTINITINAESGLNERDIADQISRMLDERDRRKAARVRSAFHDID